MIRVRSSDYRLDQLTELIVEALRLADESDQPMVAVRLEQARLLLLDKNDRAVH